MSSVSCRVRLAGILGILALSAAAAACGGDSAPEPPDTSTPTPEPSVTEAPATSTTAYEPSPAVTEAPAASTTVPEPPAPASKFDIDEDTTLREAFNTFANSEQACIRDNLDDDLLESVLDMPVLDMPVVPENDIEPPMAWMFSCLDPVTANEFFLSTMMAAIIADAGEAGSSAEIGVDERACVRDRFADLNVASYLDALVSTSADTVLLGILGCMPDRVIESVLAEVLPLDEFTEEQRSALIRSVRSVGE